LHYINARIIIVVVIIIIINAQSLPCADLQSPKVHIHTQGNNSRHQTLPPNLQSAATVVNDYYPGQCAMMDVCRFVSAAAANAVVCRGQTMHPQYAVSWLVIHRTRSTKRVAEEY